MFYLHVLLLALIILTQLFFFWLSMVNLKHGEAEAREQSAWLEEKFGVEDVDRLLSYNRLKTGFGSLQSVVMLGLMLLVLYSGLFTGAVELLCRLSLPAGWETLLRGEIFFLALSVLSLLVSAPFSAFKTFVIEEIFDFNTSTVWLWCKDKLKGLAVGLVITALLAGAVLYFIQVLPTYWWLAGWALFVAFNLLMQIIYPRVIAPLFNDFEPVEAGELRDAVEEVFECAGFHCSQIYTMDASRRSSHSNAYFIGFGRTKRVVLFDTLIEQMELPQVQSVLAHELAHWKKGHIWKRLGFDALKNFITFFILYYLVNTSWLYSMFSVPEAAIYAGFVLAGLWLSPLSRWLSPLTNYLSIRDERAADEFAFEVLEDSTPMINALYRLAGENLSNPFPHPLYAAFHYSHPPIPDRIRYLKQLDPDHPEEAPADAD